MTKNSLLEFSKALDAATGYVQVRSYRVRQLLQFFLPPSGQEIPELRELAGQILHGMLLFGGEFHVTAS